MLAQVRPIRGSSRSIETSRIVGLLFKHMACTLLGDSVDRSFIKLDLIKKTSGDIELPRLWQPPSQRKCCPFNAQGNLGFGLYSRLGRFGVSRCLFIFVWAGPIRRGTESDRKYPHPGPRALRELAAAYAYPTGPARSLKPELFGGSGPLI